MFDEQRGAVIVAEWCVILNNSIKKGRASYSSNSPLTGLTSCVLSAPRAPLRFPKAFHKHSQIS